MNTPILHGLYLKSNDTLHIKAEQGDVTVPHDIFLSLGADQAFFLCGGHATAGHQVLKGHNFRTDKAFFKICVNFTGSLRGFGAFFIVQARTSFGPAVR